MDTGFDIPERMTKKDRNFLMKSHMGTDQ